MKTIAKSLFLTLGLSLTSQATTLKMPKKFRIEAKKAITQSLANLNSAENELKKVEDGNKASKVVEQIKKFLEQVLEDGKLTINVTK